MESSLRDDFCSEFGVLRKVLVTDKFVDIKFHDE